MSLVLLQACVLCLVSMLLYVACALFPNVCRASTRFTFPACDKYRELSLIHHNSFFSDLVSLSAYLDIYYYLNLYYYVGTGKLWLIRKVGG